MLSQLWHINVHSAVYLFEKCLFSNMYLFVPFLVSILLCPYCAGFHPHLRNQFVESKEGGECNVEEGGRLLW